MAQNIWKSFSVPFVESVVSGQIFYNHQKHFFSSFRPIPGCRHWPTDPATPIPIFISDHLSIALTNVFSWSNGFGCIWCLKANTHAHNFNVGTLMNFHTLFSHNHTVSLNLQFTCCPILACLVTKTHPCWPWKFKLVTFTHYESLLQKLIYLLTCFISFGLF